MKTMRLLAIGAAAAGLAGAPLAQAETMQERGEAQLAKMLEGFKASGEARQCVRVSRAERIKVIAWVGVVYDDGDTIYVARADEPRMLTDSDIPVFRRTSSLLCSSDALHTIARGNTGFSAPLFLKDFVPYTRVDKPQGK